MPEMTVPEAEKELDRTLAQAGIAQGRWSLGLAAGNGAGLGATVAQVIAALDKPAVVSLLLPSCWLFAAGLFLAGIGPGIELVRHSLTVHSLKPRIMKAKAKPPVYENAKGWVKPTLDRLYWIEWVTEAAACGLFGLALVIPLASLSRGYVFAL